MQPLVTVAIPAYNHAKFIVDCLDSVVQQDYPHIELVVIDDGSRDATPQLIEDVLRRNGDRFARVVFKSRPNRGVSATSNECFANAQGEWVHLLGSDDRLKPGKISRMMTACESWQEPQLGLIFADADYIDANGTVLPRAVKEVFPPGVDRQGYQRLFLANRIPNPTVAIRHSAFIAVGGFDESLFLEDWDMWLRLAARFPIARVPEVLASYRYHSGNTHHRETEMLEAGLRTFGKFLYQHGELLDATTIRRNWRKNLHRLMRWARRRQPALLPGLFVERLTTWRTPPAQRYFYYADRLAEYRGVQR